MRPTYFILLCAVVLYGCKDEEVIAEETIDIVISNENSVALTITTEDDAILDTLTSGETLPLSIKPQPYTYFRAYHIETGCAKDFVYINGLDNGNIEAPLFSQCDDGDLYIISVLDTLEYHIISTLIDELYPELAKVNIYQRSADADQIIDFAKYNSELSDIERDTLNGFPIDSATTADYWQKNINYDRWYRFKDEKIGVIPRSEMLCLLQHYDLQVRGLNPGDYECKYPGIPLFQFSRVGFNTTYTQGLLSFYDDKRSWRVLMTAENNKWKVLTTL